MTNRQISMFLAGLAGCLFLNDCVNNKIEERSFSYCIPWAVGTVVRPNHEGDAVGWNLEGGTPINGFVSMEGHNTLVVCYP